MRSVRQSVTRAKTGATVVRKGACSLLSVVAPVIYHMRRADEAPLVERCNKREGSDGDNLTLTKPLRTLLRVSVLAGGPVHAEKDEDGRE